MTWLQHPLSTLHAIGCPLPRKTRSRLVVSLYRMGVEPTGHNRKFQLHRIPFPQAWPDAHWLFAGSDAGADRIATILTVLGTAAAHGVDPLAYLTYVLRRIAEGISSSRVGELMPEAWAEQQGQHTHAGQAGIPRLVG